MPWCWKPIWGSASVLKLIAARAGYGESTVLHDISLQVRPGTLVALVGANAAGKSTIAGVISGLVPVQSGCVEYKGADINAMSACERVRQGIIQIPEGRKLFPLLTVGETLVAASSLTPARAFRRRTIDKVFALFP